MAKPTSIKDALQRFMERYPEKKIEDVLDVGLQFQWPPIEKMDNSLAVLQKCQKLSLSTNMIDKIAGVSSLKNLKILSLARNNIKTLAGLDSLGDTLEQLWISYNVIEKTRGIDNLKNLKVLYISYNNVKVWSEFDRIAHLPLLEDLLFVGNPLYEATEFEKYHDIVIQKIPTLRKLEGETVVGFDDEEEDED